MKSVFSLNVLLVLMCGVFGDEVKITVMEGDSVTLHTDLTDMKRVTKITWRDGEDGSQRLLVTIYVNEIDVDDDESFRDRLQVDEQTGDLTIKNMRVKHSGRYEAEIIKTDTGTTYKNFTVTVSNAPRVIDSGSGDVKSVSVNEGESVTLHTDVQTHTDDLMILWRFGDEGLLIAKGGKEDNKISIYDHEGFRDRLKLDDQTGSLTISDVRSSDSGLYKLKISSNSKQTLYKTFSVYVRSSLSSGAIAGISALLVVIAVCVIAAGVFFYRRKSQAKKLMNLRGSSNVLTPPLNANDV